MIQQHPVTCCLKVSTHNKRYVRSVTVTTMTVTTMTGTPMTGTPMTLTKWHTWHTRVETVVETTLVQYTISIEDCQNTTNAGKKGCIYI